MTHTTRSYMPGPWHTDEGTIRNQDGDALASYPWSYAMGDQTDRNNGELMAAAPELLAACDLALRTINDTIRHENLKPGNLEALEDIAAKLRSLVIGWRPLKTGAGHD